MTGRCGRCGGALAPGAACWCVAGRHHERAVADEAARVLDAARNELIRDALAVVESVARSDAEALRYMLASADVPAVAVTLAAIVVDLAGELARRSPGTTPADLLRALREGSAGA